MILSSEASVRDVVVMLVVLGALGALGGLGFSCIDWAEQRSQDREEENQMAKKSESTFWVVGWKYFIRTVTMYLTGELVSIEGPNESELVFKNAAWIACTKRFADSIAKGEFEEVEPYPDGTLVVLNRTAIIDACKWEHELPRTQK